MRAEFKTAEGRKIHITDKYLVEGGPGDPTPPFFGVDIYDPNIGEEFKLLLNLGIVEALELAVWIIDQAEQRGFL